MRYAVILFSCLTVSLPAFAASYYVDYVNGNDTFSGTCETAAGSCPGPWQHAPGMQGFSGTYAHSSGDQIIFKGGVTWPNAVFPLVITNSGSGDLTMDYYGVDTTWFDSAVCGASFCPPVFDMQTAVVVSTNDAIVVGANVSEVKIDNLEIRHFFWTGTGQAGAILLGANSSGIVLNNLYIHSWTHDTLINGTHDVFHAVDGQSPNGDVLWNSQISALPGGDTQSGTGAFNVSIVSTCTIHDLSNGVITNVAPNTTLLENSTLYNFNPSFDGVTASRVYYSGGRSLVVANVIHDFQNATSGIVSSPQYSSISGTDEIFNNVVWNSGALTPFVLQTMNEDPSQTTPVIFSNNTIAAVSNGYCLAIATGTALPALKYENNQCISSTLAPNGICTSAQDAGNCGSITTLTVPVNLSAVDSNLVMSSAVATADGYTTGNFFAPTASTSPTVDQGATEPQVTQDIRGVFRPVFPLPSNPAFDVGAYEFCRGACPAPFASFTRNPASGVPPLTVSFDASASNYPGGPVITGYGWDFGDGQTASLTQPTTSHVYINPGVYVATLTVTTSTGPTSINHTIEILRAATLTLAAGSGIGGGDVGLNLNFTPSPDDDVSSFQFDLTLPASVSYDSSTLGPVGIAAGKQLSDSPTIPRVVIFGLNVTPIATGVAATVYLHLAAGIPVGTIPIPLANLVTADPNSNPVPVNGVNGSIIVTASQPAISTGATVSGTVGIPLTPYQITAINSPTSYGATGLPPGLSVNTGTGLITGIPLQAGVFDVQLSAENSVGSSAPVLLVITIVSAPGSGARVFPNPWRSDQDNTIPITFGLLNGNATIKIFTASGYLVRTLSTTGATFPWNLKNDSGDQVASGLYFYLINDASGKNTGELVIIR